MNGKKWSMLFIGIYVSLLILIGGITYIVDPYFHFHKPLRGMSYSVKKEAYVNDGISKNFDYNAMLTGTSLTLGFNVQEANEIFGKEFVRTTFQGEGFKRINDNIITAIENNPELEMIIRGVDTLWFTTGDEWSGYEEYPTYLYDNIWWNDVKYLYNKDVLMEEVISQILRTVKKEDAFDFDSAGRGGKQTTGEHVIAAYERSEKQNIIWSEKEEKEMFDMFEKNLEKNVLDVIEKNPNITFYLFFPPYSICWWDGLNQIGPERVKKAIEMEEVAIDKILEFDNVHLFSFFNNYDIVCDLRNYTDEVHFTDNVSSEILNYMKRGEYELTRDNYKAYLEEITEFYCNYNYESIFE